MSDHTIVIVWVVKIFFVQFFLCILAPSSEYLLLLLGPYYFCPLSNPTLHDGLDYCDIKCFALETNRDHSVIFEIASKYCISDSFVNNDGYSISFEGFLPAVVDIMVI